MDPRRWNAGAETHGSIARFWVLLIGENDVCPSWVGAVRDYRSGVEAAFVVGLNMGRGSEKWLLGEIDVLVDKDDVDD